MFKGKISKVVLSLLVLSILLTSVFAVIFLVRVINNLLMEKDFLIIHLLILMNMTI